MTAKEKVLSMDKTEAINLLTEGYCPSTFGIEDHCVYVDGDYDCKSCWNREIPDEPQEQPTDTPTQPQILDSGNRREFETGAKRDISDDKGRFDLLPWAAIMEIAKHSQNGSKKYGEHNVDLGIPTHSLLDSACRHVAKYLDGWTDEPHLIAAAWNLLWAIQMEVKMPEMVDTPWSKEQTDEHE